MTGVRQLGNRVQSSVTGEGVHCKFKTYNDQKEKRSDKVIKPTRYGRKRRVPGVSGCAVGPRREPWGNTFPSSPKLDPPHAKLGGVTLVTNGGTAAVPPAAASKTAPVKFSSKGQSVTMI